MWSVPYNLNLHDTYMGIAMVYNRDALCLFPHLKGLCHEMNNLKIKSVLSVYALTLIVQIGKKLFISWHFPFKGIVRPAIGGVNSARHWYQLYRTVMTLHPNADVFRKFKGPLPFK
jgi:hypothetical protein